MLKNKKSIFARIAASALALCLLCSCSHSGEVGVRTVKSVASRNTISAESKDPSALHYSEKRTSFTAKAASSGLIEMYIDDSTKTFCIYETTKKQYWSVLPLLENIYSGEELLSKASMASIKVTGGTDSYELNTQDNSLAYGKASYTLTDNGAVFTYDIFPDEKTAAKQKYDKTDIGFSLKMTVTLEDGSMIVGCTYKNITGNPDACIESMELLNYFGAYNDTQEDDYLLVPDGSGAIIRTSIYDESFESLSFDVYGSDPSLCGSDEATPAIIPAFGIKHGGSAFVSLIQKGDAVATVHADKATNISEYNRVYPSFDITPVKYEDETLYISNTASVDELSLCYRFLTGQNATYAGLASACREQLIRNSVHSTKTVQVGDYLPFCLTLTGAVRRSFGPFSRLSALTTFEQAQDMLVRMKNKGINNVFVRYTGIFSGGTDSEDITHSSLLRRLGGSDKLDELYQYISSQKMSLFLDIDILSSSTGFSGGGSVNIKKDGSTVTPDNVLAEATGKTSAERTLAKVGKLAKTVSSVLTDTRYNSFTGFCFNDAGKLLYSDFSDGGLLRADAANAISSAISPLSTGNSSMTVNGNFYMLKNIDVIVDMPLTPSVAGSGAYVSVPFVPLVLHGIVDYAGEPINTETNLEETLLRSVEYGACPHFEWNYEPLNKNGDDKFYYDNTINEAAEFYSKANEALNDLRDARMTDHYEVADGVFCTEYDTGAMIYVNYTDESYSTRGVVVDARSFLRVN